MYPSESSASPRYMDVEIDSGLVHLGVDGCIGESNEKENSKTFRVSSWPPFDQIKT